MTPPGAMVVVPPTVGHVNHGVALANVVREAGFLPVLITGTAALGHVRRLNLEYPWACLPSHDLEHLDRDDPRRRPHLEQLCDPRLVRAAVRDQRDLVARHRAAMVIGKDYFAAVLTAAACGIPYVSYYTDGVEALLHATSRQTVSDPDGLTRNLREVAAKEAIDVDLATVPDTLRSGVLNIVRGFPRTAAVAPQAWQADEDTIVFAGALTYDASVAEVDRWSRLIAELGRPLYYVTFGTTLGDPRRFAAVADAAQSPAGRWLVADPDDEFPAAASHVVVERYVPNAAALANATVVMHHGGHGTTLSALMAGVPQLVVPDNPRTQQSTHGLVLQELGVGQLMSAQECSGEAIVDGIANLSQPAVRARALGLSDRLRADSEAYRSELTRRLAAVGRG
ncbi:glycosyltransferase [Kribbella sp. DT2]|uniref:glycosyltransferase n=1 Tax=Kribbella sp. DT2 TaxID=3393427 RepID=UPI003CFB695D